MSWLSSFLHPERGYDEAQKQIEKYWNEGKGFQQPFVNNATDTYSKLAEALKNLLNPGGLQDQWNKNYQESDYAKNLEKELGDRGLSTAASMGLGGSSTALQTIQAGKEKVVGQERQQYLDDLMKKYMTGIGLGEDIYGVGANTAGNLGNQANQVGQNTAQTAFGKQNAPGGLFGNLLGLVGSLVGGGSSGGKNWNVTGG